MTPTYTVHRSTAHWTFVSASLLTILSLMMAYSYGVERWIEITERADDTAVHWRDEAQRCYSNIAPTVYMTERGYEVLRAATQRRVVVQVETSEVDR